MPWMHRRWARPSVRERVLTTIAATGVAAVANMTVEPTHVDISDRQAVSSAVAERRNVDGSTVRSVTPASLTRHRPSPADRAVRYAYAQLGKPYLYGGTGPYAFDCSGLTQRAWLAAGVRIPRTSQAQADFGMPVSLSHIQPGDLVIYYPGRFHVGIYVGGGRVIVAPHSGAVVRFARVTSMPISTIRRP